MIELAVQKEMNTSNGKEVLSIISQIPKHKITAIYGPSGVGKTTLLRMLSGLTTPDEGKIIVNEETWFDSEKKINVKPQKRNVGFVFQDYALFPNMTIKQNIMFGLKDKKETTLVNRLLEETHLTQLSNQYPSHISGGQKQRVALARALVLRPSILLMDEPLSALDIETRIRLRKLILELHTVYKTTTLLVSHDIPEIFSLADQVMKIENNQLVSYGSPKEAFNKAILKEQFSNLIDTFSD